MVLDKVLRICAALTLATTLLACFGGGSSGPVCDPWFVNAPATLTVPKGGFNEVTFVPSGTTGLNLIHAYIDAAAAPLGITIEPYAGNTYHIVATTTTPSGVYNFELTGETDLAFTDGCRASVPDTIEVTVP